MVAELRVRTRIPQEELEGKHGRVISPADWNVLLTGACKLYRPDGKPLCVYLPGVMRKYTQDADIYAILHELRKERTDNRGMAAGAPRAQIGSQKRTRTPLVASAIAGAIDPGGVYRYCRLTAWTGSHLPAWQQLQPMLKHVAAQLAQHVPDRYAAQERAASATLPEWRVPGTPFTTITVNNTYPTGVHTDKGDLDAGFSTITCLRRGQYTGGQLCFPQYRVAVDLHDGDLLLMDAHDWHGNATIICRCGHKLQQMCDECDAERISVVAYYRTKMQHCGTPDQELAKARARREI